MPDKTYNIDVALNDQRPSIQLRGEEYLFADLSARQALIHQRQIQMRQEKLAREEEEFERRVMASMDPDVVAEDEDIEPISEEEIREKRESIAERLQEIIAEGAKLLLEKPVKDEDGNYEYDENGRIRCEPFPDEVAAELTQREMEFLQAVAEDVEATGVDILPSAREEKGKA